MSRLLRDVKEVQNFLRLHMAAGVPPAQPEVLMQAQSSHLQMKFRHSPPSIAEASEVLEALNAGPWTDECRQKSSQR